MTKALFILLLALFAAHVLGVSSFEAQEDCAQPCPGESPEGHCPPLCTECACCFAAPVFVPIEPLLLTLPDSLSPLVCTDDVRTSNHPREILHIPKCALS